MGARTEEALELWREGTHRLLAGELEEAVDLFTRSLETEPTAEAYTFRGWAYSFAGRLPEAIEECRKAIATDPSFGNPYNDIGCYLMEQGDGRGDPVVREGQEGAPVRAAALPVPEPRPVAGGSRRDRRGGRRVRGRAGREPGRSDGSEVSWRCCATR